MPKAGRKSKEARGSSKQIQEKKQNKLKEEVNKQIKEVIVLKKQLQESQQGIFYFYIILIPSTFSFSFSVLKICAFELF